MAEPQPPSTYRQPDSLFSRAATWLATHLAATIVAVAGAVFYGVLRVSYATFYGRFDVEPEEVGLGQTEIVTQTGILLFISVLFVVVVMGLAFLTVRTTGLLPDVTAPPGASLWRRAMAFTATPYWIVVIPTIVILAFLVVFELPGRARSLADRVERGETIRPPVSLLHWNLNVKALPAKLTSLNGNGLTRELRSPSLRYLGRAGGVLVLYDWKAERTVRLPVGSVLVTTSK